MTHTHKKIVPDKRDRWNKWDHDAAVSGYKAEKPGVVFHTSAGAADNAWSVSIQANSLHLSVLTQEKANKVFQISGNYRQKQMSGLRVKVVAESEVAKTLSFVTEQ